MSKPSILSMPTGHTIIKAGVAGGAFALAEHLVLKNGNIEACAMNGASIAGGIVAISTVSESILGTLNSPFVEKGGSMTGMVKGIEQRVLETAGGAGGAFAINYFLFKAQLSQRDMMTKLGMIVVADLIGEAVADLMTGQDFDLFA